MHDSSTMAVPTLEPQQEVHTSLPRMTMMHHLMNTVVSSPALLLLSFLFFFFIPQIVLYVNPEIKPSIVKCQYLGNPNQPKWGHLKELHEILMSMEKTLTYGDREDHDYQNLKSVSFYQNLKSVSFFHLFYNYMHVHILKL